MCVWLACDTFDRLYKQHATPPHIMMPYTDQKKNNVTTGGKWLWDYVMSQVEYLKDPRQLFLMFRLTKQTQCYALYQNASAFAFNAADSKPIDQRAYEVIPPDAPCKAYADIHFDVDLDTVLAHYKQKAMIEYGIDAEFEISDVHDHSARIIISNMTLANNNDGTMENFFKDTAALQDRCYILQEVYSKWYSRHIQIQNQEDEEHIARCLVTNPTTPVVTRAISKQFSFIHVPDTIDETVGFWESMDFIEMIGETGLWWDASP